MSKNKRSSLLIGIGGAILAYLLFFWQKPWHHIFTYGGDSGLFVQPIIWLFIAVFIIALLWIIGSSTTGSSSESRRGWAAFFGLLVVVLGFWYWSANAYGKAIANSYTYAESASLDDTNVIRWTAYEIGESGIAGYNNSAVWDSGDVDPHPIDGEFVWQAPRIPLGASNSMNEKSNGIFIFHEDETISFEEQTFSCGEGMWFGNSLDWALRNFKYDATYTDHLYWNIDDEYVIVTPYIVWKWSFPVRYPVWGGVMVTDSECNILPLTPEEAMADPGLDGLQIFPEDLAIYQVEKWHYKFGNSFAPLLTKKEVFDIPRLSEVGNQQPYLLSTVTLGTSWTFMTDPTGNGDSLARVFYFNAETGFLTTVNMSTAYSESFVGLQQGALMAQNAYPTFSWDTTNGFIILEALPVVKNGFPYWQYTITNAQKKDTVGVVTVNAKKSANESLAFCSAATMKLWLSNLAGSEALPCPQSTAFTPPLPVEEITPTPLPTASAADDPNSDIDPDLSEYSDEELWDTIRRMMEELERRAKDTANAIFFWK